LNEEIFCSLKEAQVVIEKWRVDYNTKRPHSALGYVSYPFGLTPSRFRASRHRSAHGFTVGRWQAWNVVARHSSHSNSESAPGLLGDEIWGSLIVSFLMIPS
jgi:hypothetical protein